MGNVSSADHDRLNELLTRRAKKKIDHSSKQKQKHQQQQQPQQQQHQRQPSTGSSFFTHRQKAASTPSKAPRPLQSEELTPIHHSQAEFYSRASAYSPLTPTSPTTSLSPALPAQPDSDSHTSDPTGAVPNSSISSTGVSTCKSGLPPNDCNLSSIGYDTIEYHAHSLQQQQQLQLQQQQQRQQQQPATDQHLLGTSPEARDWLKQKPTRSTAHLIHQYNFQSHQYYQTPGSIKIGSSAGRPSGYMHMPLLVHAGSLINGTDTSSRTASVSTSPESSPGHPKPRPIPITATTETSAATTVQATHMSEALDQGALSGGSAEAKAPVDQTRMQLPGHDQFDGHFYGHGHGTLTTNTQSHPLHIRLMPKKEPRVGRLVMSRSKLNSPSVSSLSSAISSSSSRQSASIPGSPMDTDPLESLVASDVPPREAELFGLDSPRRMRPSSTLSSLRSLLGNHPQGLSLAESLDEDVGGEGGDNLDDTDAISDQDSYNSDSLLGERVDAADGDKVSRLARRRRLPPRFEWMTERERLSTATLSTIALDIQDSQKGQHALWKYIGGRNVHAPIDNNIGRILDSGCGLGEWTMDMAALYPNATVYGVDINSELFPSPHQHVPSNCLFTQANILNRLLFPDGYFNFVYQRFLFLGLTVDDWPMVLRELKRVLKPGGWIELFEPRMHVHRAGPRTREVMRWISRLLQEERGLDFDFAGEKMKQLCESDEIGFENVTLERLSIPVGRWGGRVGEAMAENMVLMFQNLQSALLEHEGTQPRDLAAMRAFDAMVQSWIRECEANQSYIDYFILVAQRIS